MERVARLEGSVGHLSLPLAALAFLLAGCASHEQTVLKSQPTLVTVQQVSTDLPKIHLYVDVRDAQDRQVEDLAGPDLRVEAAGRSLVFDTWTPFRKTQEGIAFALLIDDSLSVKKSLPQIKSAAQAWIGQLGAKDRIALVRIGSADEIPVFGNGGEKLLETLARIEAKDSRTRLYDSIHRTLRAFAASPELPRRRAIVLVTDGEDDDDVSGATLESVTEELRNSGIPLYAIGINAVPATPTADLALKVLAELAKGSHGLYRELNEAAPGILYNSFHTRILDVYEGDVTCNSCPHDGEKHTLRVAAHAARSDPFQVHFNGPGAPWYMQTWVQATLVVFLILVGAGIWYARRLRRRREEKRAADAAAAAKAASDAAASDAVARAAAKSAVDEAEARTRAALEVAQVEAKAAARKSNEEIDRLRHELESKADGLLFAIRQQGESSGRIPDPPPRAAMRVVLSVIQRPEQTRVLELHDRLTIGKGDSCDFRIADERLGDCECEIRRQGAQYTLTHPDGVVREILKRENEFYVGASKVRCLIG